MSDSSIVKVMPSGLYDYNKSFSRHGRQDASTRLMNSSDPSTHLIFRVRPIAETIPRTTQFEELAASLLEQCINEHICLYVEVPKDCTAHTNRPQVQIELVLNRARKRVPPRFENPRYGIEYLIRDTPIKFIEINQEHLRLIINAGSAIVGPAFNGGLLTPENGTVAEKDGLQKVSSIECRLRETQSEIRDLYDRFDTPDIPSSELSHRFRITIKDLYIGIDDIKKLNYHLLTGPDFSDRYGHEALSPGVFLLFKASYFRQREAGKFNAEAWLRKHDKLKILWPVKRIQSLSKFVNEKVNRTGGRAGSPTNLEFDENVLNEAEKYRNSDSFVSNGLSLILLATDWWHEHSHEHNLKRADLLDYLRRRHFDEIESDYIADIIIRKQEPSKATSS